MSSSNIKLKEGKYEKELSEIIQRELVSLYEGNGYKSIIQTMIKISGRKEEEIITNYELFAELSEGIFGRLVESKILALYKTFLEYKGKEITTVTDGKKCIEMYKRETRLHQSENYFDVIILDQKMPIMTRLDVSVEMLNINPQQKIMFVSGYVEKTILEVLSKLNKAITVIEKSFSLKVLDHMIHSKDVFEKLDKITINQEEKEISAKVSEIMTVLEN